MSLLIVEDNKDLVQVLAEGFAENGFSVESAFSGEEGLEKSRETEIECVISISCFRK
jgi:two-component system copper resistance phosphate regulon response regulator CusR